MAGFEQQVEAPGAGRRGCKWQRPVGRMLPDGISRQLLPDDNLDGRLSLFSSPYPHCGLNRNDENFAVPVFARFGRGYDEVHDSAGVAIANDNLELDLWQKRGAERSTLGRLGATFLASETLHLRHRHTSNPQLR